MKLGLYIYKDDTVHMLINIIESKEGMGYGPAIKGLNKYSREALIGIKAWSNKLTWYDNMLSPYKGNHIVLSPKSKPKGMYE